MDKLKLKKLVDKYENKDDFDKKNNLEYQRSFDRIRTISARCK